MPAPSPPETRSRRPEAAREAAALLLLRAFGASDPVSDTQPGAAVNPVASWSPGA